MVQANAAASSEVQPVGWFETRQTLSRKPLICIQGLLFGGFCLSFSSSSSSVFSNITRVSARQMVCCWGPWVRSSLWSVCRCFPDQQQHTIWHFAIEFYGKTGESGHILRRVKIQLIIFHEALQRSCQWSCSLALGARCCLFLPDMP